MQLGTVKAAKTSLAPPRRRPNRRPARILPRRWESYCRMWTYLLFVVGGAAAGWAYSATIGCSSGACLITRYPPVSAAYGALMGLMLARARLGG